MAQQGDRECATVIQGVNSQGWAIPPFIIVAGKFHLSSWYEGSQLPKDWRIAVSDNGWTTNERGLEWIQHFDKHTKGRTTGAYRLLILDGHESHHSTDFELYCKENHIVTLCMPAHSSHILQPLDVGCFGPLKKAYGRQIEEMMRKHITHITKADFFPAFYAAFQQAMIRENIQGGFRGAGVVPFSPESVLSRLDVKLRTPTPSEPDPDLPGPWVPKTPNNPIEATSQSEFLKSRIARHQSSSPTSIYQAIDHFTKGAKGVMHQVALLRAEVQSLREANHILSKRRRAKRTRVRKGGSLTLQEGQGLVEHNTVQRQGQQGEGENRESTARLQAKDRHCRRCGNTGHNIRTCKIDIDLSQ